MIPRNKHAIHPDDARSRDSPSVLKEARPFWKKTRNARATPISHHTPRHKYVLVGRWLLGRWLPPRLPPRLARGALRAARGPVSPDSSRGRSKPLPCLAPCSARLRLGKGCFARVASLRRCSLSTALPSLFPPPGTCSVRSLALSARIFSETGATTLGASSSAAPGAVAGARSLGTARADARLSRPSSVRRRRGNARARRTRPAHASAAGEGIGRAAERPRRGSDETRSRGALRLTGDAASASNGRPGRLRFEPSARRMQRR